MAITTKTTKILWAAAAGRCSFSGCWQRLCSHDVGGISAFTIGEMAHIRGERPGSNRHDPFQSEQARDDYQNLILLCPTHHRIIDQKENETTFSVEVLHAMKNDHEGRVLKGLNTVNTPSRVDVAREIHILLSESRESWRRYGPGSDFAQREPHNEEIYAVWVSERLSIIVPNNRRISDMLEKNREIFEPSEQEAISSFLTHARSYEKWVHDEIYYSAVVKFPAEFSDMIMGVLDAGV